MWKIQIKKWLEITLKAIKNNTDSENAGTIKKLRYLNSPGFNFKKKCFMKLKSKIKRLILQGSCVRIQMERSMTLKCLED